jgi:hypothetical protein
MQSTVIFAIAFVCIMAGTVAGMTLRRLLPQHHLGPDAKDVVRLGAGLIGTIAALVLGLLIGSAKNSFDTQSSEIKRFTASIILLDQLLMQYGPEATPIRRAAREAVASATDSIWRGSTGRSDRFEPTEPAVNFNMQLQALKPQTDIQRELQTRMIQVSTDLAQTRLMLFARGADPVPAPFLVVLIFWVAMIFVTFSLFSEANPVVIGAQVIFALSAAGAIFLILELSHPFSGLMQISSTPVRAALLPL